MKQKLNWDIFSLGLRLKASLPGKKNQDISRLTWKGMTGTYWQKIQATFTSFTTPPPLLNNWQYLCSNTMLPPRSAAFSQELGFSICPSVK